MIEHLEIQRVALQANLDAEKTSEERNRMGQFSTPSPLARDILEHARTLLPEKQSVRFLDPALGSGAFYAALRRVFEASQIEKAQAFEIDPHYGKPAEALWASQGLRLSRIRLSIC
jgi:adenine-specific DNA-methyltransferase